MKATVEDDCRNERIERMGRWDRFRVKRSIVIDAYIKQRKIQQNAEGMVRLVFLRRMVRFLSQNYAEAQHQDEVRKKSALMSIKIFYIWKGRLKRWGGEPGNISKMIRNSVRRGLTCGVPCLVPPSYERALKKLQLFLQDNFQLESMRIKIRLFYVQITYMQRRIRD